MNWIFNCFRLIHWLFFAMFLLFNVIFFCFWSSDWVWIRLLLRYCSLIINVLLIQLSNWVFFHLSDLIVVQFLFEAHVSALAAHRRGSDLVNHEPVQANRNILRFLTGTQYSHHLLYIHNTKNWNSFYIKYFNLKSFRILITTASTRI